MIGVKLCGWIMWSMCFLLGMEKFSAAMAYSIPSPVLSVLLEYQKEAK